MLLNNYRSFDLILIYLFSGTRASFSISLIALLPTSATNRPRQIFQRYHDHLTRYCDKSIRYSRASKAASHRHPHSEGSTYIHICICIYTRIGSECNRDEARPRIGVFMVGVSGGGLCSASPLPLIPSYAQCDALNLPRQCRFVRTRSRTSIGAISRGVSANQNEQRASRVP